MRVDHFDFDLPEERIALHPAEPRDGARLLTVSSIGELADGRVTDLETLLKPGDVLVINDTRVLPAELSGMRHRGEFEANVNFNLHKRFDAAHWDAFARPAKRLKTGDIVEFIGKGEEETQAPSLHAQVKETFGGGMVRLRFELSGAVLDEAIKARGAMPLPPYIGSKRALEARDATDYQTVFAKRDGAVAAPTAGLHFTDRLLEALDSNGVHIVRLTLHVGAGTFLPMKVNDTLDHQMHAEWGEIDDEAVARIKSAQAAGGRIAAVGTTSLRLLESAARSGQLLPFSGDTSIFITPGYRFQVVDMLLTNFHLPRSTLFMLVSAFSGLDVMQRAYAHAIENNYRFYSYGDTCLLTRAEMS